MVVAVGQIIGPVLGGWLTTTYGWPWTFWFNVPFGIISVLWGIWAMGFSDHKSETAGTKKTDSWGYYLHAQYNWLAVRIDMGADPKLVFSHGMDFLLDLHCTFPIFLKCGKEASCSYSAFAIILQSHILA